MFLSRLLVSSFVLALPLAALTAQGRDSTRARDTVTVRSHQLDPITVTVTRSPERLFTAPQAVSVIDSGELARRNVTSPITLFTELPGADLTGVGPNQLRPMVRGFVGQRILLLEDGLRLNNSRREEDFGELPAIVDLQSLDRVEVVRGPSSVLYGSDAIGGVVNLIGANLPWGTSGHVFHGALRYTYTGGSADVSEPSATLAGRDGRIAYRIDGGFRDASPYSAPAGSFGGVTLGSSALVQGTGVDDRNLGVQVGAELDPSQRVYAKFESYRATDAGFGYVDPALLGADQPLIQINYPHQRVDRVTAGYLGQGLHLPFAQRIQLSVFSDGNRRDLAQNIFAPFGPGTPPGAGVAVITGNFTDIRTIGARLEASRNVASRHALTYGIDISQDQTQNTDSSVTTVIGFGPPTPQTSTTPNVPDASYLMMGVFAQDEIAVSSRLTLVLGARYQDNTARTRTTPGLTDSLVTSTDRTVVGAMNALFTLSHNVNLVGSVSRGFRSPDLVERFFNGLTPEGDGFQARNTDLHAETSIDVELGVRMQHGPWSLEVFGFQNNLHDGIRVVATGDTVNNFPVFQNVNIDHLRIRGIEAGGELALGRQLTVAANYTLIDQENVAQPLLPVGDEYGNKINASVRYHDARQTRWLGFSVRHLGKRYNDFPIGSSPVGTTLPGFTETSIDGGTRLLQIGRVAQTLTASVENIGDVLYAEAGNAGFFRPQPGRRLRVGWRSEF